MTAETPPQRRRALLRMLAVSGPPAVAAAVAGWYLLPWEPPPDLLWTPATSTLVWGLGTVGAFALGVLTAAATPRTLVAVWTATLLGAVYVGVLWLLVETDVPLWWSAGPLPVLFLAAARRYDGASPADGSTWRSWWRTSRPAVLFLTPWLLSLGTAALVYRATAIPVVPLAAAVEAALSVAPSAEAVETADLYHAACAKHRSFLSFQPNSEPPADPAERAAEIAEYLAANQEVVELTLAASRRPTCAFFDRATVDLAVTRSSNTCVDMYDLLHALLPAHALRLENAGDLAGAAERYSAILRGGRHYAPVRALVDEGWGGIDFEYDSLVLERLVEWAWREEQTPELVHAMIVELESAGGLYERSI
ncbi:MAG: hypothetical protein ACRDD1_14815, partial [Planctomycetia bacterium]